MSTLASRTIPSTMRYAMVSGLCLAMHNALMIATDRLGIALLVGIGLSFGLVNSLAYVLHCRFTYRVPLAPDAYARYLGLMSLNTPMAAACLWVFARTLAWPMTVAAPVASCVMIAFNFASSRVVIPKQRPTS